MKTILTELKGILELEFQQDVQSLYHDWNYLNNTGMITAVFEKEIPSFKSVEQFPKYKDFIGKVERISILVQKKPDKIEAFQITSKLYLVNRDFVKYSLKLSEARVKEVIATAVFFLLC